MAPVLYMGHFFLGQSSKDAMAHALTEYFQALAMSPKDPLVLVSRSTCCLTRDPFCAGEWHHPWSESRHLPVCQYGYC